MSDKPIAVYSHRAKPYAQEAEFRLMHDHVAIDQGRRSGAFPFRDIVMIRLMYKPRNTTNEGYFAKLYRRDRRTASLTNLSWKSLVDMERQDADYTRFVVALIREIKRANPQVVLVAGMPRWRHAVTTAVGLCAVMALVIVTAQAALNGSLPVAAAAGGLGLFFGWWTLRYLARNRPRAFVAEAIPPDVMPPSEAGKPV